MAALPVEERGARAAAEPDALQDALTASADPPGADASKKATATSGRSSGGHSGSR